MQVRLIASTKIVAPEMEGRSGQDLISYVARVSNPNNQLKFDTSGKLNRYLIENQHWSPFEHVMLTVEIQTSRAIAQQILRHRSFVFQEFSQRYASVFEMETYEARRQDTKNRQNSIDDFKDEMQHWFVQAQEKIFNEAQDLYKQALEFGIAKECARFLLPLNTKTVIYMTGSARSWIHYLQLRCHEHTQKEHRDIADAIKQIFIKEFPDVADALEWKNVQ